MALHGFVWVNDEVIGHYDIVRQHGVDDVDAICRYRYVVHFPGLWREAVTGEIAHRFVDGAPALIAAVLHFANDSAVRIPGRPVLPDQAGSAAP
jgi:hypothetical protein